MKPTLLVKGIAAFVVIALYVGVAGFILDQERTRLSRYVIDLEQVNVEENTLTKASYAISNSMIKWQGVLLSAEVNPTLKEQILLDVELVWASVQKLRLFYPVLLSDIELIRQDMNQLRSGFIPAQMLELQEHGRDLNQHLNQVARKVGERRDTLWVNYSTAYNLMTETALTLAIVGVGLFGLTVALFLTQIAWDIKNLSERAIEIVSGYRGAPVAVTRRDEVGDLMEAVNRMQVLLREREQQLEISREQYFYKEKMAAIGSLAAAVAHEINNPIAAISGIAEFMKDADVKIGEDGDAPALIDLILEHSRRIATMARQIGEFTQHQSPVLEMLDLNALIRNTCGFIGYDKRFRYIELKLELDPQIPAVVAIADHLIQVLMNLLINASDALENVTDRKPVITVATRAAGDEVWISVDDNGIGMDAKTLAHAFEKAFTTKPLGKGRGLGLFLCKSLLEEGGHRIEMTSTINVGTMTRIRLMVASTSGD